VLEAFVPVPVPLMLDIPMLPGLGEVLGFAEPSVGDGTGEVFEMVVFTLGDGSILEASDGRSGRLGNAGRLGKTIGTVAFGVTFTEGETVPEVFAPVAFVL